MHEATCATYTGTFANIFASHSNSKIHANQVKFIMQLMREEHQSYLTLVQLLPVSDQPRIHMHAKSIMHELLD